MTTEATPAAAPERTPVEDSTTMCAVRPLLPRAARAVRILAAVGLAFTVLPLVPGRASAAGAALPRASADYTEVGTIPRVPAGLDIQGFSLNIIGQPESSNNGIPIISEASGKMYQFYQLKRGATPQVGAVVRDLKTLGIVNTFLLPADFHIIKRFVENRGTLPHTIDTETGRIFFWLDHADNVEPGNAGAERSIFILDEAHPTNPTLTRVVKMEDTILGMLSGIDAGAVTRYRVEQQQHVDDAINDTCNFDDTVPECDANVAIGEVNEALAEPTPTPGGVNPTSPRVPDPRLIDSGSPNVGGVDFQGMTFIGGRLYVIMTEPLAQDPPLPPLLLEVDAGPTLSENGSLNPDLFDVNFSRFIRGCRSIFNVESVSLTNFSGTAPVAKIGQEFFVPCAASNTAIVVSMPAGTLSQADGPETVYTGTGVPIGYLVDSAGGRIHLSVFTPLGSAILTFDTTERNYIGLQAVDNLASPIVRKVAWGLDPVTGRVYTQVPASREFGLAFLSGRFTPVQPATVHPELPSPSTNDDSPFLKIIPRDSSNGRVYVHDTGASLLTQVFRVLEDVPPALQPDPADPDRNTKDVPIETGLSSANYSGGGSGYGVRQLLVGGAGGFVPARLSDGANFDLYPERPLCQRADREVVLGLVLEAKFSNAVQAAQATPASADSATAQDLALPSRCTALGKPEALGTNAENVDEVVFGTVGEDICDFCVGTIRQVYDTVQRTASDNVDGTDPNDVKPATDASAGQSWPFSTAACRPDARDVTVGPSANFPRTPAPINASSALNGFSANVNCTDPTAVSARASTQAPGLGDLAKMATNNMRQNAAAAPWANFVDNTVATVSKAFPKVTVASVSTSTKSYLDPNLGVVTVTESVVKGVDIGGVIQIAGIYSKATSVASGRPGTPAAPGAHATYERALWGVVGPGINCNLCASPAQMEQLASGLSAALGDRGRVIIPKVDADLLAGSPGGYQAAVQRDPFTAVSNDIVSGDSLKDVPALEIQLFNDGKNWGRQRQIIQFAGVKANSQYGIFCLGGGSVEGGHCVLPPAPPNSLTISLTDDKFKPLAGGTFTAKGPETQSCTTGPDGRCTMPELGNGSYAVSETKAPDGYSKAKEVSVKMTGGSRTANFVNKLDAGRIVITLSDSDTGAPLAGGAFEVVGDANGNGAREPTDPVVARCTTQASGACPLKGAKGDLQTVSLGAYVVQQTAAPKGYTPAAPAAFALVQPGDEATLDFTNGSTPTVVLGISSGNAAPIGSVSPAFGGDGGGFDNLPFGPVADLLDWAVRNPGQAILFASSVALFGMPLWQSWKRRQLIGASIHPF